MVANLGRGTLMAKADIEAAYRLVPVGPDDRPLLAMQWKGDVHGYDAPFQALLCTTNIYSRC